MERYNRQRGRDTRIQSKNKKEREDLHVSAVGDDDGIEVGGRVGFTDGDAMKQTP